jgi:hypothetical protein
MIKDIDLLNNKASKFYDSIYNSFIYKIRNDKIEDKIVIPYIVSIFYFVLNIFPFFPYAYSRENDNYLGFAIRLINKYLFFLNENEFLVHWILGVIFSGLIFLLVHKLVKQWYRIFRKKAIHISSLNFCYLNLARNELQNYLVNAREEHLIKAKQIIFKKLFYHDRFVISEIGTSISNSYKIIKQNNAWFEITDRTKEILRAFDSFNNKFFERIKQDIGISEIIPVIDLLILIEFSKIKPNESNSENINIGTQKEIYFDSLIDTLNNLSNIQVPSKDEIKEKRNLKFIFSTVNNWLKSDNVLVLFISWLILLSIIYIFGAVLTINLFGVNIDTTLLASVLTVPFLGSITVTVAIYNKNKK